MVKNISIAAASVTVAQGEKVTEWSQTCSARSKPDNTWGLAFKSEQN